MSIAENMLDNLLSSSENVSNTIHSEAQAIIDQYHSGFLAEKDFVLGLKRKLNEGKISDTFFTNAIAANLSEDAVQKYVAPSTEQFVAMGNRPRESSAFRLVENPSGSIGLEPDVHPPIKGALGSHKEKIAKARQAAATPTANPITDADAKLNNYLVTMLQQVKGKVPAFNGAPGSLFSPDDKTSNAAANILASQIKASTLEKLRMANLVSDYDYQTLVKKKAAMNNATKRANNNGTNSRNIVSQGGQQGKQQPPVVTSTTTPETIEPRPAPQGNPNNLNGGVQPTAEEVKNAGGSVGNGSGIAPTTAGANGGSKNVEATVAAQQGKPPTEKEYKTMDLIDEIIKYGTAEGRMWKTGAMGLGIGVLNHLNEQSLPANVLDTALSTMVGLGVAKAAKGKNAKLKGGLAALATTTALDPLMNAIAPAPPQPQQMPYGYMPYGMY